MTVFALRRFPPLLSPILVPNPQKLELRIVFAAIIAIIS